MIRSRSLEDIINAFTLYPHHALIERKAGQWQGVKDYEEQNMFILRDVNYTLKVPDSTEALIGLIQPDKEWCDLHFRERVGGIPLNPGESYKIWPYANFSEGDSFLKEGMKFDHSYMERFWPKKAGNAQFDGLGLKGVDTFRDSTNVGIRFEYGDYNDVITQLSENPLTRQAYLPIFFPEDTGAINNIRVPCTLGYLFEIFDGKLDITYYIRSCDVYRHLRNDVYLAAKLLIHTKNILLDNENLKDLECGKLNMKIANLHLFKNDIYPLIKREKKTNGRIS
jgi:hypothetical protein